MQVYYDQFRPPKLDDSKPRPYYYMKVLLHLRWSEKELYYTAHFLMAL